MMSAKSVDRIKLVSVKCVLPASSPHSCKLRRKPVVEVGGVTTSFHEEFLSDTTHQMFKFALVRHVWINSGAEAEDIFVEVPDWFIRSV